MIESTSPVQGLMEAHGTLSPEEQQEMSTFITPRFAELLIKMLPEMESMVQQYLVDDLMGVPEIGVETGSIPEIAPGVPEIEPEGMPPTGAGDNFAMGGGGGSPADDIASIYSPPIRGRGGF
jgi:hypothetical protein